MVSLFVSEDETSSPIIKILDTAYHCCGEFHGSDCGVALTPITERCFISMSLALNQYLGAHLAGPVGVGKSETVKVRFIDIRPAGIYLPPADLNACVSVLYLISFCIFLTLYSCRV